MVGSVASLRNHWLSLVIRFSPSLFFFGDYPLTLLPQSACVRDFFASDSAFELSGFFYRHIKTTFLSFIFLFFLTFYFLVTPASAPRLLFLSDSIGSTLDLKNYAQSFDFSFFFVLPAPCLPIDRSLRN